MKLSGLPTVPLFESHVLALRGSYPLAFRPSRSLDLRETLALADTQDSHPPLQQAPKPLQVTSQAVPSQCQRILPANVLSCLPLVVTSCFPCHLQLCLMRVDTFSGMRLLFPLLPQATTLWGGGPVRQGFGFHGKRPHAGKAMITALRVQHSAEEKPTSVVENFKRHI